MTAILFTATDEHDCERYSICRKKILVGDRAVKATARRSNSGGSWTTTVYYHEACYQERFESRMRRGRK